MSSRKFFSYLVFTFLSHFSMFCCILFPIESISNDLNYNRKIDMLNFFVYNVHKWEKRNKVWKSVEHNKISVQFLPFCFLSCFCVVYVRMLNFFFFWFFIFWNVFSSVQFIHEFAYFSSSLFTQTMETNVKCDDISNYIVWIVVFFSCE